MGHLLPPGPGGGIGEYRLPYCKLDVDAVVADGDGMAKPVGGGIVEVHASRICEAIICDFVTWRSRDLLGLYLGYPYLYRSHFTFHAGAKVEPVLVAWGNAAAAIAVPLGVASLKSARSFEVAQTVNEAVANWLQPSPELKVTAVDIHGRVVTVRGRCRPDPAAVEPKSDQFLRRAARTGGVGSGTVVPNWQRRVRPQERMTHARRRHHPRHRRSG